MNSAVTPWFQFRTKMDQNASRKPVVKPGRHARPAPRNSPRLIQRSFFRRSGLTCPFSMSPIPSQLRWPLACFCVGMRSLSPSNKKRFKTRTIMTVAFLVEGYGARLWRRKRAASAPSIDRSDRKTGDRVFGAWRSSDLHGGGNKHNRYCRQLERERRARRQRDAGNDHICWNLPRLSKLGFGIVKKKRPSI